VKGGLTGPRAHPAGPHQAPRDCPVCGDHLATTRLGCTSCGTEVSGLFASCSYCGLSAADRDMLRVFLVSRGNMKELERFLGVSYPTARQRFAELLERLELGDLPEPEGAHLEPDDTPEPDRSAEILRRLAAGELDIDEAEALLG
jgi:hypothetical protein